MTYRALLANADAAAIPLAAASVHCVVTSPPYFALRDYGVDGQIGLESTPDAYIARLVEVFREVKRVLRDDGTLWVNIGDSYVTGSKGSGGRPMLAGGGRNITEGNRYDPVRIDYGDLKPKNLLGIPWRLAFALQADGWYLRQDIIWHKPNPMPESVADRCTKAHEYVFLLTKSARYYYDAAAIAETSAYPGDHRAVRADSRKAAEPLNIDHGRRERTGRPTGETRNRRSVWSITSQPYAGAHFATMPPALAELCIRAGSPAGGVVYDPFVGSGTTVMVAQKLGRVGVGTDLSHRYLVENAKVRTGLTALETYYTNTGRNVDTDVTELPLFTL